MIEYGDDDENNDNDNNENNDEDTFPYHVITVVAVADGEASKLSARI